MSGQGGSAGGVIAAGLALVLLLPMGVVTLFGGDSDCTVTGSSVAQTVAKGAIPDKPVEGYGTEQLTNAAAIMNAATALHLDGKAQIVGVMTAMGESGLRVLDHGDAAGPDSRGLFQQRANGAWGSYEDRMNPTISATNFFKKLQTISGWEQMTPSRAANAVQVNSDPDYYTKYVAAATKVVNALAGVEVVSSTAACVKDATGSYAAANGTKPGKWGGYDNGRIPPNQLQIIPWTKDQSWIGSMYLRPDAAQSLIKMSAAFAEEFGYELPINDAYRSFARQVEAQHQYGGNAATPGTSNHGWALAVDFGTQSHNTIAYDDATYAWLKEHAGTYGWVHPAWAEPGGVGPHEAWHWEFYGVKSA